MNLSKAPYRYKYFILIFVNCIYSKAGFLCVSFLPDLPFCLFIIWKTSLPTYLVCGQSFFNLLKKNIWKHLALFITYCLVIFYSAKVVLKLGYLLLLSL